MYPVVTTSETNVKYNRAKNNYKSVKYWQYSHMTAQTAKDPHPKSAEFYTITSLVDILLQLPTCKEWIQIKRTEPDRLSAPLRKHAYSNILKILQPNKENFQIRNSDIFQISAQSIVCGYSLEPTRRF